MIVSTDWNSVSKSTTRRYRWGVKVVRVEDDNMYWIMVAPQAGPTRRKTDPENDVREIGVAPTPGNVPVPLYANEDTHCGWRDPGADIQVCGTSGPRARHCIFKGLAWACISCGMDGAERAADDSNGSGDTERAAGATMRRLEAGRASVAGTLRASEAERAIEWTARCVRGVPLPPPPQPLVPRLLVLSSEESGGSEGDVVEGEESSSGASDPDYRGMSDEAENARAVLAAYRSQNSKRARRGEPSRSRVPRAAPRSSPPGQAPVPRSRHSSASTTADNPAPGFAASAPGFAAPMGSTFAMPSASPSWPVSVPPSVSLLQGDVPAEDAMVRYGAMGDALEVEAKARQELEAQMGSLNLQCEQLSFQREQMALRERRALEGQRAAEERSAHGCVALPRVLDFSRGCASLHLGARGGARAMRR
nr:hypothetical protein Iba_chr12cCG22860 [Ipomoea batatas]